MARSVDDFLVDFSKEEDTGGGGTHYKAGHYLVRILGTKTGNSEDKGTPYLEVTFAFKEGRYAKSKKKIKERLYNTPKAMKRFRLLLQAVDVTVPKKLNLTKLGPKLKGKELYIEIDDEPPREGYDTPRSRVTFEGFVGKDDYDPDMDEDDEEEDEDLEDEEDEEEEDEEEEDEDEDEDDEEEEEEKPVARKKRSSKSKAKKSSKRKSKKDEDDEDEDLDDLDLDDM